MGRAAGAPRARWPARRTVARLAGGLARRGRAAPRTLGRRRVPAWTRRHRRLPGRARHRGRGHLRRHHLGALVQEAPVGHAGPPGDHALRRGAVRPRRRARVPLGGHRAAPSRGRPRHPARRAPRSRRRSRAGALDGLDRRADLRRSRPERGAGGRCGGGRRSGRGAGRGSGTGRGVADRHVDRRRCRCAAGSGPHDRPGLPVPRSPDGRADALGGAARPRGDAHGRPAASVTTSPATSPATVPETPVPATGTPTGVVVRRPAAPRASPRNPRPRARGSRVRSGGHRLRGSRLRRSRLRRTGSAETGCGGPGREEAGSADVGEPGASASEARAREARRTPPCRSGARPAGGGPGRAVGSPGPAAGPARRRRRARPVGRTRRRDGRWVSAA